MTTAVSLAQQVAPGVSLGFKNRLINGGMVIDQRYAGAAWGTSINGYTVDRWNFQENQTGKFNGGQNYNSVTPPVGFTKYIGVQSQSSYSAVSTDYFNFVQIIEGNNVADLAWGTANAKTVTVSFWAYSSLTGTFSGSVCNASGAYSYVFTYSIPVANTWTYITTTIAGPSVGSWPTDTNGTLNVRPIDLGSGSNYRTSTIGSWVSGNYIGSTGSVSVVGTNGATFYLTGVQLEVGTAATNFEFRDYGRELALCQRYYWTTTKSTYNGFAAGLAVSTTQANVWVQHPVSMRDVPTYGYSGTIAVHIVGAGVTVTSIIGSYPGLTSGRVDFGVASGLTAGQGSLLYTNNGASNYFYASSEI